MSAIVLQFEHVEKSFRHFPTPLHRVQEIFWPFSARHTAVPVLQDVSFSVARGESVAIIGANGVGKSTLLHLVAGLLEPSSGRVTVHGSVAALLDLGGSFLPELTGRENARFYQRLVARPVADPLSRERAIEEFAELGEFFDRPVRTYSSGMFLRLAFACATAEEPDLIVIDEVLVVGDARFQQKCYARLAELRDRGTTILLVTHVMSALAKVADRVLVLEHGQIVYDGEPRRGIDRYYQLFFTAPEHAGSSSATGELRYGSGGATISRVTAHRGGSESVTVFKAGETVRLVLEVDFQRDVEAPELGFSCTTKEGTRIYSTTASLLGLEPVPASAGDRRTIEVLFRLDTAVGDVFLDLSVFELANGAVNVLDARMHVLHLSIALPTHYSGIADISATVRVVP